MTTHIRKSLIEAIDAVRPYFYSSFFISYDKGARIPFGDSAHHTGFFYYAMACLHSTCPLLDNFMNGFKLYHYVIDGTVKRNPLETRWCNRDQLTPLLAALEVANINGNFSIYNKQNKASKFIMDDEIMMPDDHFWFKSFSGKWLKFHEEFIRDVFFTANVLFNGARKFFISLIKDPEKKRYKENSLDSSVIKGFLKLHYWENWEPTLLTKFNTWLQFKLFDGPFHFKRYFTFKHNNDDEPPPIHLIWELIFLKWRQ